MEHLSQHPTVLHVCLFAMPINRIDATGVESFAKLEALLHERGISLHISGMKLPVETVLRRAGCLQAHAGLHLYRTDAEAIASIDDQADGKGALTIQPSNGSHAGNP